MSKEEKKKQGEEGKITKTSEGDDKDFKAPGIEGEKGAEEFQEENTKLKEENANLHKDSSKLKSDNAELATRNSKLKSDNAELATRNSELEAENSELKTPKPEESEEEEEKEKTYVTGEDVIKTLRGKGHKI